MIPSELLIHSEGDVSWMGLPKNGDKFCVIVMGPQLLSFFFFFSFFFIFFSFFSLFLFFYLFLLKVNFNLVMNKMFRKKQY